MEKTVVKSTEYANVVKVKYSEHIDILEITHPNCTASVSLYAGHVLAWQPANEKPVLWLSKSAQLSPGTAIRGGIPICWPWFGPKLSADNENVGNHGFARTAQWQLQQINIQAESVEVVLILSGENMHAHWPHAFELTQKLVFSSELQQSIEITNTTGNDIELGHALHTYFAVSSPKATRVASLDGIPFDDKVTGKSSQKDLLDDCVGQIDRVYYDCSEQVIHDAGWHRDIIVSTENSSHWVLWNPGKIVAASMADIHEGGENEYVCLEAADAKPRILSSGQKKRVVQKIRVKTTPH